MLDKILKYDLYYSLTLINKKKPEREKTNPKGKKHGVKMGRVLSTLTSLQK
jgi:hypothetical protein